MGQEQMDETLRTFIAVEMGAEVRKPATELIKKFRSARADVKWVEPHNLHITLKFLGEVEEAKTEEVCRAVTEAAAASTPFSLEICGAGAFPHLGRPRTIWLGTGEGRQALVDFQRRIEAALKPLGFLPESRRFEPHLTIGRVRNSGPGIAELAELLLANVNQPVGRTTIDDVVVFSSALETAGPIYEALARADLGGKPG
jgi:RNA 2',3'-cyclic 3'-phosphodiesterase